MNEIQKLWCWLNNSLQQSWWLNIITDVGHNRIKSKLLKTIFSLTIFSALFSRKKFPFFFLQKLRDRVVEFETFHTFLQYFREINAI